MKKFLLCLSFILMAFSFCFTPDSAQFVSLTSRSLTSAKGMCVVEASSNRVLYEQNAHKQMTCASTTKVVTAITVLENCRDINKIITVNPQAVGVEGTSIYLNKNEQIKIIDLLFGLMLRSGNDSAAALAYEIAGSVEDFAKLMNETAKKAGAASSNFCNPHGLDQEGHYTTAYDLALITSYALQNETFREIVKTKNYVIPATNIRSVRYLSNKNRLLGSLEGCIGVKTGYTSKAGRCLVSATERNGMRVVCVVLNCGPMFEESVQLLNKAYADYEYKEIIKTDSRIFNEYYIDAKQGTVHLYSKESFFYPLKPDEINKIQIKYSTKPLKNIVEPNEEIGEVSIFFDNQLLKTLKLYTINKIDVLTKEDLLKSITNEWME